MNIKINKTIYIVVLGLIWVVLIYFNFRMLTQLRPSYYISYSNSIDYFSVNMDDEILTQEGQFEQSYGLSTGMKDLALKTISVFENDTTQLQYGYIENLDDGRGYTAGFAGFTSAYDDFYQVIELYSSLEPGNELQRYLPKLKVLVSESSGEVDSLKGLPESWQKESSNSNFILSQHKIFDKLYYNPAMQHSEANGIYSNLGKIILLDSIVQHGNWTDPDGLPAMINHTNKSSGKLSGNSTQEEEIEWLKDFLIYRKSVLQNPDNQESQLVWSQSTDRCDYYLEQLSVKNLNYDIPIKLKTINHEAVID